MDEDNTIYFYSANGPYGCFSNFSRHTVFLKDKKWPTSEHYFQAQKFAGTPFEEQVRCTDGPGQSAKMGRNRSLPLRKDWEKVKEGIMKDALIAKFSQHADIKATLLSTANKTLVEHTANDTYWADGGGPGCGKNRLGFLLMEVRDEMLAKENGTTLPTKTTPITTEAEKEQEETTTSGSSGEEGAEGEGEGAEERGEEGGEEGLEPNRNRMYEVPASAEKKTLGTGKKKVRRGGVSSKSRTKRSAFRDEDGSSKLEKTNETKGAVTVIGEGTVFSEKALPPQAKFVVHRHQMQRKYHPTEKDFEDEPEEEEEAPKTSPSKKNYLSEFVAPKMKGDEEPVNELVFVNNEARRTEMVGGDGTMTADECIAAAKTNLDLLAEVTDPEVASAIKETCNNIKNNMSRYIEEFAEANNADQLLKMMEQFEKLQAAC